MVSRRAVLKGLAALGAGSSAFASYAFGIEPMWRLRVQSYRFTPPRWTPGLTLRVAVIADIHAGDPQMPVRRLEEIVGLANALKPDVHLLLGDFEASHRWMTRRVPPAEWSAVMRGLKAPLGVHAVLGNHDWWDDIDAQVARRGPVAGRIALERQGIPVYENDAVRLVKDGRPFWLAGLGDQLALIENWWDRDPARKHLAPARPSLSADEQPGLSPAARLIARNRNRRFIGVDDLPATLRKITDDAPVILMAHEPDAFATVPERVSLTLSGHTHGGQIRLLGYSPLVPSRYGNRYAYGHIVEDGRHLVVSGGLGCSILPVRFGVPPEIVLLELGAQAA